MCVNLLQFIASGYHSSPEEGSYTLL